MGGYDASAQYYIQPGMQGVLSQVGTLNTQSQPSTLTLKPKAGHAAVMVQVVL